MAKILELLKKIPWKKIFREDTPENNKKDFYLAKRIVAIILYFTIAVQLFQEFFSSRYFDQFLIILSMICAFVFLMGIVKKYARTMDKFEMECYTGNRDMMDFRNEFIASMLIPMVLFFKIDNVIFTGTTLWSLDDMKKIILAVAFVSIVYYKVLVHYSKVYSEKVKADAEYADSNSGIKFYKKLSYMTCVGSLMDVALLALYLWLVGGMEWKNANFANVIAYVWLLLLLCAVVLFFINDKKRIILSIMVAVTVLVVSYYSYVQFSEVKKYTFETADYTDVFNYDDEGKYYVRIALRFEKNQDGSGVYKYYLALHESTGEGDNLKFIEDAYAYGRYEATEFKNTFFKWEDRDSDLYYKKSMIQEGEIPVSIAFSDEVVECGENSQLKKYVENNNFVQTNFDDKTTGYAIVGKDYIVFRGNGLEKSDDLPNYVMLAFDEMKI